MPRGRRFITKDVYPNFMSGRLSQPGSVANVFTTVRVNTPIPRLKVSGNKATVMELLWLDLVSNGGFPDGTANFFQFTFSIGAPPTVGTDVFYDNPLVFLQIKVIGTGPPNSTLKYPIRYDFQSNDGYGYLLASDAFNISVNATLIQAAQTYNWKLFYRFVDIPIAEFVGIVQSTQQI